MHKFWHHTHKSSTDSITSVTGFHNGYIYKIINQYDDSVISLQNYKTIPGALVITEIDSDGDCQRFKATRIREGENGGEFEVQSVHQDPIGSLQVWEYNEDQKILVQNASIEGPEADPTQSWTAIESREGSRVYFIKPVSEDICLTNMGNGKPIGLFPPKASDLTQQWILEPIDYVDQLS